MSHAILVFIYLNYKLEKKLVNHYLVVQKKNSNDICNNLAIIIYSYYYYMLLYNKIGPLVALTFKPRIKKFFLFL